MTGPWRHSGARVFWDHESKGPITRPLLARLVVELAAGRNELPTHLVDRLRQILIYSFDVADLYVAQNVSLLADEYRLDAKQRETLLAQFLAASDESDSPERIFDGLLDERRMDPTVRAKGLSATHRLVPGSTPVRDLSRLIAYCEDTRWRAGARAKSDCLPFPRCSGRDAAPDGIEPGARRGARSVTKRWIGNAFATGAGRGAKKAAFLEKRPPRIG